VAVRGVARLKDGLLSGMVKVTKHPPSRTEGHPMSLWHAARAESSTSAGAEEQEHNISSLVEMLGGLTDPRSPQGIRHELVFTLACAVVAVLAGASNYRQVGSRVGDLPQSLLAKLGARWNWFGCRYDWPSEPTLRRVLQTIDAGALDLLIGSWLFERAHRDTDGLLVIAVDGKVLRGAWTDDNGQVTLFSAMIHGVGVTVAQIRVPDGTNEITQVDTLLAGIPVGARDRVIITLDAAHTQYGTAEHLRGERGFDYMMTVKGNQPALQKEVFARCLPLLATAPAHFVEERTRGWINRWSTWTTDATGIDFPHAAQLGCIRRDVLGLDGKSVTKEYALIITSSPAEHTGPADLHTHVRQHWGIENKSHYVRDTAWREDHHQAWVGNGPHSMAALRNLAVGLFRLNGIHKIKEATEWICGDRNRALPLLAT
jgi:predicted transposase YbfD/YdcC